MAKRVAAHTEHDIASLLKACVASDPHHRSRPRPCPRLAPRGRLEFQSHPLLHSILSERHRLALPCQLRSVHLQVGFASNAMAIWTFQKRSFQLCDLLQAPLPLSLAPRLCSTWLVLTPSIDESSEQETPSTSLRRLRMTVVCSPSPPLSPSPCCSSPHLSPSLSQDLALNASKSTGCQVVNSGAQDQN
jgi:hypothetical protein